MRSFRPLALAVLLACVLAAPAAAGSPLVGYWPMSEGSGQVVHDFSGNGNNGFLGSSLAVEPSDPAWIHGGLLGAMRFSGSQSVTIPASPSLDPAHVTVAALVRGSSSPGQWHYVVSNGSLGCTAASYGLYTGFGGGIAFYVFDGATFQISPEAAPASIWNGKWHLVAGTFDGSVVRVFVDGRQIGAGTPVSPFSIDYDLPGSGGMIGAYGGCNLSFVGDIDEVSIWSTALPISQIAPGLQALAPLLP